jgi:hypothetical protein
MSQPVEIIRVRCASRATPGPVDLEVRPEGLCFPDGAKRWRLVPWDEIDAIRQHSATTLQVRAGHRLHCFILPNRAACADLVADLNGRRWASRRVGQASPEQVAKWLEEPPGEGLQCDSAPGLWPLVIGGFAGYVLLVALNQHLFLANLLFWCGLGSAYGLFCASKVAADADGLVVVRRGHRTRYPWADIIAVRWRWQRWIVTTTTGTFAIHDFATNARRLVSAIEKALAAREAGLALPTDLPVSDTALSRMTGEAEVSERGLSVAEGSDG